MAALAPEVEPPLDKVVPAGKPLRVQIPSVSFDTDAIIPKDETEKIKEWSTEDDNAAHGLVQPGDYWAWSLVYDTSVAGGGLFGTDVATTPRIDGHTSPWNSNPLGAFNVLQSVEVGDVVAITTDQGLLCYNVSMIDHVLKTELDTTYDKYDSAKIEEDTVLLQSCDRPTWWLDWLATDKNIVVKLKLNQSSTNAGTCWVA